VKKSAKVREAQKAINLTATATKSPAALLVGGIKAKLQQAARNAVAVILRNEASDRYEYGPSDNLPNTIISTVDDSGTATVCAARLGQFIAADGFIQDGLDKVQANSKQKLREVLAELSTNIAYLEGLALLLVFDVDGSIRKIFNADIKTLRRKDSGFERNPLMGEIGKRETETQFLLEYDPDRSTADRLNDIKRQIKQYGSQQGEILYIFRKGLGRYYDIYPVPRYFAGIEDIVSDGKLSRLELRNITQGFRTPVIISTGPIDDVNKDDNELTAQDKFDEALQSFTGEDASPILHLKGETEEFKPTVTTIDVAEILDQTDRATDRLAKKVARLMQVPDVLIGIAKEGQLGNMQELKNQMALFALTVYERQQLITDAFDRIAPRLKLEGMEAIQQPVDFTLTTLKPFDLLPPEVLGRLSDMELRELFEIDVNGPAPAVPGAPAMMAGETNESLANLSGRQLQNILRIVKRYNKGELDEDQAAQLLMAGYGLTQDQANVWLVTKDEEEPEETPNI
jgi:hypothetical protein